MAIDSTAELLFKISADPSEAKNNIAAFRQVLGKDLAGMRSEFDTWAKSIFGNLGSFKGAAIGATAALAGGAVAVGAALFEAGKKAADYAHEIEEGMHKTGLTAEEMSKLKFEARSTGVEYEKLVSGLVKFESFIVKARDASSEQAKMFHRLGISQREIEDGQKQLLPILDRTADAFHQMGSTVEKAAAARELFGRGGADFINFLSRGSEGLRELGERAEKFGLVLTEKDIVAAKTFRIELRDLNAQMEGLWVSVGTKIMPALTVLGAALSVWSGTWKRFAEDPKQALFAVRVLVQEWVKALEDARARARAAFAEGGIKELLPPETVKKTTTDFRGLSELFDQVRMKLGSVSGEMEKVAAESVHLDFELDKAAEHFRKLQEEGNLSAEALAREKDALGQLPVAIERLTRIMGEEFLRKRGEAIVAATDDLNKRLMGLMEQTFEQRQKMILAETKADRDKLVRERTDSELNLAILAEIEKAGLFKLGRERSEFFDRQRAELQQYLSQMVMANMTTFERLGAMYRQDLARFKEVEDAKKTAQLGPGQRGEIEQQFIMIRAQLTRNYQNQLQSLVNSQGWRGVFGSEFAAAIRGNEALLREWSESANQSTLMVRMAMEALNESLQRMFQTFAKGMAANIAQAIIYKQSIGEAMRAAVAAALESIAAESLVQAIYATALGFLRLAQHDYAAAAHAFTAAAVFGSVGVAAAVAGRAIAPNKETAAAREAGAAGSSGGAGAGTSTEAQGGPRTQVHIYVNAPIVGASGIEEFTDMVNDAVRNRDVRLVATQVRQESRLIR